MHIANHVPMYCTLILASSVWITCTQGHVNRSSDLFIKKDIFDKSIYFCIGTDCKFAKITRTFIGIKQTPKKRLIFRSRCVDHFSLLKT